MDDSCSGYPLPNPLRADTTLVFGKSEAPRTKERGFSAARPDTGVWESLFKTEAYHSQGAKEAAEVGGRGTFSAFPMYLTAMALSGDGPPAALREVELRVRASKLSVLKRDSHTPP